MKLYLVAAVIWMVAVTATSESHGNWSNEKVLVDQSYGLERSSRQTKEETKKKTVEEHYSTNGKQNDGVSNTSQAKEPVGENERAAKFASKNENDYGRNESVTDLEQRFSKHILQPYVLTEAKAAQEGTTSEPISGLSRPVRTSQNDTVIVEYLPSQEIILQDSSATRYAHDNKSNDLSHGISESQLDVESIGDFGQRVRSSSRHRNENPGRIRSRQPLEALFYPEDHRKSYRKHSRPSAPKKPNAPENTSSVERLSASVPKIAESQRALKQKEAEEDFAKVDYLQSNKVKPTSLPWRSEEVRENKPRKHTSEQENAVKDSSSSTAAPALTVSLGKFSGPIVVPDLPRQKKYSYAAISDHSGSNDVAKPTEVEATTKQREASYLAASPVVLSPLQAGVALMNAGQDINSVNSPVVSSKDYLQDEAQPSQATVPDNESLVQNDAADPGTSSLQGDQLPLQEQISEVVASHAPAHSVEIQKSVEVFHPAPVQEIHYPVEFVPHAQLPKQHDFRKLQKSQPKDRRPGQSHIYKSNEILDEIGPSNSQERGRYEYNVNENDVIYSAMSGQVEQVSPVSRPPDNVLLFARDQLDNGQYDQGIAKQVRIQGNSEILKEAVKQSEFEIAKGPSSVVTQASRVVEALPGLPSLENPQGAQEAAQILLAKGTNEPQPELRLLLNVPQPYSIEKVIEKTVHVPHALDVVEKVPYPVEKVIEKQITIPQPFPVHVPIDRIVEKQIRIPYPVHVEKVIEKKVPFTIQRFIIPFPIHFRVPQPISVEKVVEKAVPVGTAKLVKSGPIYNAQNDGSYQQIRQNFQAPLGPLYGSAADDQGYFNATQFYGLGYAALNRPHVRQPVVHAKKFGSYGVQYPHAVAAYSALIGNNGSPGTYGRVPLDKDEYMGPVPRKALQGMQSKSLQYASPDVQSTMRRTRQEVGNTGSFRQSKMEYGFKPPMVPSVQYDEQTATKVE
ncbi:uncharacterized protein LOC143377038 [Andrena cerasifolii]|uniref:uncharacterized protein LOC143377038 n=1 Tax=Andrena cerasifolii TaxID=2819439 RepID=UPI004037FE69